MMEQPTFADVEYESKKRRTRREVFLERMDGLIPWQRLEERIRPYYPKAGRGRHPFPVLHQPRTQPTIYDRLIQEIKGYLESRGLRLREGTSGRHHHRSAVVHQEPGWGARP